jgi:hypothetical protein
MSPIPLKSLRARDQGGFALLVTIVLVAFLVLVLVGLATFSRVENQVADNSADVAKARQNAMNALNLAIGQLQRHAGPDERVTARSDLVGGVGGNSNNAHFTGVWDTTGSIGTTPAAWLVSGTEGSASPTTTSGIADHTTAGAPLVDDANDTVFVVYNASVGGATAAERRRRVRLNKQPIEVPEASLPGYPSTATGSVSVGHYAYWVGDEGVKASVAVTRPDLSSLTYDNSGLGGDDWNNTVASSSAETGEVLRNRLSQFGQPFRRIDEFYPDLDYSVGDTAVELGRVTSVEQLRFVTTSSAISDATRLSNFQTHYHDVTPLARGVLARTDAGTSSTTDRLRRDLSGVVTTASSSTTGLRDYWVLRPDAYSTTLGTFSAEYEIKGRKTTGSPVSHGLEHAVFPVLSEAGLFIAIDTNGGPGSNEAVLSCTLMAEFWNPYAATLVTSNNANLRVRVNTSSALSFSLTDAANTHNLSIPAGDIITVTMPAGERFDPGMVRQMRNNSSAVFNTGTTAKLAIGGSGASGIAITLPLEGASLPDVDAGDITIILEENQTTNGGAWTPLQTFALRARQEESGVSESGAGYYAGYGFELIRNLEIWSNPFAANARDPRAATFTPDDHFEALSNAAASHWDSYASFSQDPGGLAGEAPFQNNESIVLFDLPRQEITSVAQLRHMIGPRPYEIMRGSSAANSNDAELFDATFVSTVPRNYASWNPETEARPNRYLEIYTPEQAPSGEFDSLANKRDSLRDADISARFQLIRGAFNINSTSVAAWSAVLGSTLADWDTHLETPVDVNRAFFRVPHGAQEKGADNLVITDVTQDTPNPGAAADLNDDSALHAVGRRLTPAEIDTLADTIVAELIAYGKPFASLAEFISAPSAMDASRTLLQKAIDDAHLNDDIGEVSYRHAAGAITPGDIVAAIAPFMTVRSDTFKIRAYGDVRNPVTDTVTSRAWCEAIVQRVPDLAPSPGDPNAASAAASTVVRGDPSTYTFGRKFKIVSFRWLNTEDI